MKRESLRIDLIRCKEFIDFIMHGLSYNRRLLITEKEKNWQVTRSTGLY